MKKTQKLMLAVNLAVIATIFVLNYFYQSICVDHLHDARQSGWQFYQRENYRLRNDCRGKYSVLLLRSDACVRLVHRALELDRPRLYGNVLSGSVLFGALDVY